MVHVCVAASLGLSAIYIRMYKHTHLRCVFKQYIRRFTPFFPYSRETCNIFPLPRPPSPACLTACTHKTRARVLAEWRFWQARGRYRATRAIIRGFDRLMSARRARQFLRQALATAHRIAGEELLQAG